MEKKSAFCINFWAGIVGNILEYYDTAVFSLLVPFIAPLFFPTFDPITAMVLTYGMLPLGTIARPIGSLFFGYIGDRQGRKNALSYSLTGLALITGLMGCLPTYDQVGYLAPALMALGRILQNLFLGGEAAGGAVFILEHSKESRHSLVSSLYGSSTIIGITLASSLITFLSWAGHIEILWRIPFWIGFATAVGGLFIRRKAQESPQFDSKAAIRTSTWQAIKAYWRPLVGIIAVSGFSSSNYILALILPNGFLPKVTQITSTEVMALNSALLLADMVMLPVFGYLADRLTPKKSMLWASLASFALSIPLYASFEDASWHLIVIIRMILVALGVWFSAPLHAWIQSLIPAHSRYLLISLGYAVGTQLIGSPAASLSLWLYKETSLVYAPGIYWTIAAGLAALCIYIQPAPVQEETWRPAKASSAA